VSRTRRFLAGLSVGYLNQGVVMLAALWLTPFLLIRLGTHEYGLWLLATQLLAYLALLDLGIVALLPREIAYARGRATARREGSDPRTVVSQTMILTLCQLPLVAAGAFVVWQILPSDWEALRNPLRLVLIAFVVMFPLRVFAAALQGLQDLAFLGWVQLATWFLATGLVIGLVLAGYGLDALAIGWIAAQILATAAQWIRLLTSFPEAMPRALSSLPFAAIRQRVGQALWVSAAQVAQVLHVGTDLVIIGASLGASATVPYSCTGKLVGVLGNGATMIMQAASPALSELKMSATRERLREVCTALCLGVLIASGWVFCTVLVVNEGFVGWWVQPDQFGGFSLTVLFLVVMLLRHVNTCTVYTIFCFGYERRISATVLADAVVTLVASLILVRHLGPIGAPLGSIVGVGLVSLPWNFAAFAVETGLSWRALLRVAWPWLWRFALLAAGAAVLATVWVPRTFFALACTAVFATLAYGAFMLPVLLKPPLRPYVRAQLTRFRATPGPA
jgi:O-antigen/teichoic acid export membrane protein